MNAKSDPSKKLTFLFNWRFWSSLLGGLLALFSSVAYDINGTSSGRYGPATSLLILAGAGFYSAFYLIKGWRGLRFTLIGMLCLAFIIFVVLGLLSIAIRN